jgi:hypothetical protein
MNAAAMSQQVPMPGESNSNLSAGSLEREEQEVYLDFNIIILSQQVPMPGESNSNLSAGSLEREEQEVYLDFNIIIYTLISILTG